MASHVTHLLFAEDMLSGGESPTVAQRLRTSRQHSYLVLGAQGPDIFYHNQRRRPTALAYGSLMHRRGYGAAVAHMWEWAHRRGLGVDSWAGAWILGFASHAILDRHVHPYINAHAGWAEPGKPETQRYRSMHPFLERLIDVEVLDRKRNLHPNELDFLTLASCGDDTPEEWIDLMGHGLRGAYKKADSDTHLAQRLNSAYLDTIGYYRFTNYVDDGYLEEGLRRQEAGEIGGRWLSIIHPPEAPDGLDVLNERGHEWPHPCSAHEVSTESFLDRYDQALEEARAMTAQIVDAWELQPDEARARIEAAVHNWNLSDGRPTERPCTKHHARPLPLPELQDRIRESIRHGDGGRLTSRSSLS